MRFSPLNLCASLLILFAIASAIVACATVYRGWWGSDSANTDWGWKGLDSDDGHSIFGGKTEWEDLKDQQKNSGASKGRVEDTKEVEQGGLWAVITSAIAAVCLVIPLIAACLGICLLKYPTWSLTHLFLGLCTIWLSVILFSGLVAYTVTFGLWAHRFDVDDAHPSAAPIILFVGCCAALLAGLCMLCASLRPWGFGPAAAWQLGPDSAPYPHDNSYYAA